MKILILANSGMGILKFRKELILKMNEKNHEVYVSIPDIETKDSIEALGCKVIITPLNRRGKNPLDDIKLLLFYNKIEKKIKPDFVFTYTIKPNIYGGLISRINSIPYAPNITGLGTTFSKEANSILKLLLKYMYKISLKSAKIIFFQNENNLEIFKKLKITKSPTKVLPGSGVNTKQFQYCLYPQKKDITFVYFGRIMKEKGINEFLEAAKIITSKYSDVTFQIIGFSEDEQLSKKVSDFSNRGFITLFGFQKDTIKFIENASAIIQPSYSEGMSNVLLEASSSGRPVLASNIPGCKEIVDKNTGILFEPKEVDSLVSAIEKFINMPFEAKVQMGINGRRKVKKEFSREIVIKEYLKIINETK